MISDRERVDESLRFLRHCAESTPLHVHTHLFAAERAASDRDLADALLEAMEVFASDLARFRMELGAPKPLFEALLLGLLGGIAGCLMVLPINGIRTGTTNFQTFTEVAFAFRVTPIVLTTAVSVSLVLGLLGGAYPAWKASRLSPTEALRRR